MGTDTEEDEEEGYIPGDSYVHLYVFLFFI